MIRAMGVSVLVVDDDGAFLALATRVLREMGVVATTAPDGAAAARAADETRPGAILVDVGLPDCDGLELAVELAALAWRPRVILTSTDDAIRVDAARSGLPFVPKEEIAGQELRRLVLTA